mmetsp:Transcript_32335/g.68884  ORF Transcript_32335/g.68884 Transcript_32335/m.68884 type:complete len:240 (+) Transcript_32335:294-1013(+)
MIGSMGSGGGDVEAVPVLHHELAEESELGLRDLLGPSLCRGGEGLHRAHRVPPIEFQSLCFLLLNLLLHGRLCSMSPSDDGRRDEPTRIDEVGYCVECPKRRVRGPCKRIAGAVSEGAGYTSCAAVEGHMHREGGVVESEPDAPANRRREPFSELSHEVPGGLLRAHGSLVHIALVLVFPDDGARAVRRARGAGTYIGARVQRSALVVVPHVRHELQLRDLGPGFDGQGHARGRTQILP